MKVLVFNCGTDSLRSKVVETDIKKVIAVCNIEAISTEHAYIKYVNKLTGKSYSGAYQGDFDGAVLETFALLTSNTHGVYSSIEDVEAIGHRIVHGGEKFFKPVIVDPGVLQDIKDLGALAPIHNLKAAKVIEMCYNEVHKQQENVGVFDTAFHQTIPDYNYRYAVPDELYKNAGVRKFGFHGTSYQNVVKQLPSLLGKDLHDINAVIVHLGSGSSMCCIKNGLSYDTTMGYTPLDGLMMSTRSGSIDPSILPKICEYYKCDLDHAIDILNKQSGYFGICGEKDIKTLCDNSEQGDEMAMFARQMAAQNFKKNLGAMMSELDHVDAIVVTGGMGVRNARQRELFLSGLEVFNIELDKQKNSQVSNEVSTISSPNSAIKVLTVPSDEEMEIAVQTEKTLGGREQ